MSIGLCWTAAGAFDIPNDVNPSWDDEGSEMMWTLINEFLMVGLNLVKDTQPGAATKRACHDPFPGQWVSIGDSFLIQEGTVNAQMQAKNWGGTKLLGLGFPAPLTTVHVRTLSSL